MSEKLSRKMSFVLRHKPESVGLALTSEGWADLDSLADALGASVSDVLSTVSDDDKQRFQVADGLVRAVQGHTSASVRRTFPQPSVLPDFLFHGTKAAVKDSILTEGLKPGQRSHVHLSATRDTAEQVASRRSGDSIMFQVSVPALVAAGVKFGVAENGVWLADSVPASALTVIA